MAHDHRMNEVGEPHLNARARLGQGRSDLRRVKELVANEVYFNQWSNPRASAFIPGFPAWHAAVSSQIDSYRGARNALNAGNLNDLPTTEFNTKMDLQSTLSNARNPKKKK